MTMKLNITDEPIVTIPFSEHHFFEEDQTMPLSVADDAFAKLDELNSKKLGYYKTDFEITFIMHGEENSYRGRFDIGVEKCGLIEHIRAQAQYDLDHPSFYKENYDMEAFNEVMESRKYIVDELVPYLQLHKTTTKIEEKYENYNWLDIDYTEEERQFLDDLKEYAETVRTGLNEGDYKKVETPEPKIPKGFPMTEEDINKRKLKSLSNKEREHIIEDYREPKMTDDKKQYKKASKVR